MLSKSLTLPNGAILPNRLVKSAMSEALGTGDQRPTPFLETLYRRWAEGGIGLSITGNVMVDRRALGEPGNVVIEDDADLPLLRRWAQAGQVNGTRLWMQLNHPGKQCPKGLNRETVAPSAIPFRPDLAAYFGVPRELQESEIEEIIRRFGIAACVAVTAGFSGIQIHGAHGYLVSQFLSPHHNQRKDRWGGSPANRRRFMLAVFSEIRRQVGSAIPIGIKLNSADFQRGGFTEEESLEAIQALEEVGIDLIEISGGTYEAPAMTGVVQKKESTLKREAYFLEFAEKARNAVRVPLMLTGGFRTREGMEGAIGSGAVDLIGLARSLAIEPDLPSRLLKGLAPRYSVHPIRTGVKMIDRAAFMEILWYTHQLHKMGKGKDPDPNQSALKVVFYYLVQNGWNLMKMRVLRAS